MEYIFVLIAAVVVVFALIAAFARSGKKSMQGTLPKEDSGSGGRPEKQ